ncbi:CAF17-like 4Fe-4S cluster assembly/insertion protein YgfZ [Marinobacter mobilis]|uniref:CAF17-like 4Fe-4S cluster assembly/insertion protein YgfZ n=1 Tax=Marinobacter mobilis TaxID=488533 RepID=UPI0035C69979
MPDTANAVTPRPTSAYAILDNQVVVRVSGPSADQFLHGQFSQKLEDVTADYSPRAAACTPKGRAYCLSRLVRQGDDVLLALPAALADEILARLQKYLMLFRGTTMTIDPTARLVGILGKALADQLSTEASQQLSSPGDTLVLDEHRLIRTEPTAEGLDRFELWQIGDLSGSLQRILDQNQRTGVGNWQASEIAAGIAELTSASQEAFVPQMLNWQHLNGVHFKKGCYTGQEVIARMHFLGQLKKSLFRLGVEAGPAAPESGAPIYNGERTVGEVVNGIRYTDGHGELLAVIRHDADFQTLTLAQSGPNLTLLALPYDVPEQKRDT